MKHTDKPGLESSPGTSDTSKQAEALVKKYMLGALAVGVVPLPLVDLAALTAVQLRLLSRLADLYDLEFSSQLAASLIGSLVGAGGTVLAANVSGRVLVHFVPVAGWIVSIASTSLFAGASTFAVGRVFIQHFDSGGTFLTFDPDKVRQYYAEQFKVGSSAMEENFAGVRP